MKHITGIVATTAAVLALAGTVIASQGTTAAKPTKAPMEVSAVGKIEKYDAASKTLTLSTTKGEQTFVLSANATIHQGSRALHEADIASESGQRAKVRYSEANGQKTADAVMILSTTSASAQKPASKPPSK
jgi:hypothetical protein